MKKRFRLLTPALLLTLLISGCGDANHELKSKTPDSAQGLLYVDAAAVMKTQAFKKQQNEVEKALKDQKLTVEDLQCRLLLSGSATEKWGALTLLSQDGKAKKLFERILSELKKDKTKYQLVTVDKEQRILFPEGMLILYNENLMLAAFNRTDPAFFQHKKSLVLAESMNFKNMLSGAFLFAFPKDVPQAAMASNMFPALQQLKMVSINTPFSETNPQTEIDFIFTNEKSASEALAMLNLGLGFAAKEYPWLGQKLERKTVKNVLSLQFDASLIEKLAETGKQMQNKSTARAQSIKSISNLKQIGLGCMMFASDNSERFPDDLNTLIVKKYLTDPTIFVAAFDRQSRAAAPKQLLTARNTTYAYVGKGLTSLVKYQPSQPLAFEKPWLVQGNKMAVLYMDGHVSTVNVPAVRTCEALVKQEMKDIPENPGKTIALKNAVAADREK